MCMCVGVTQGAALRPIYITWLYFIQLWVLQLIRMTVILHKAIEASSPINDLYSIKNWFRTYLGYQMPKCRKFQFMAACEMQWKHSSSWIANQRIEWKSWYSCLRFPSGDELNEMRDSDTLPHEQSLPLRPLYWTISLYCCCTIMWD